MKDILYGDKVIARFVKAENKEGVQFLTEESGFLQVGIQRRTTGDAANPHIHNCETFEVDRIEEVFFVVSGKMRVTFYDDNGKNIDSIDMFQGDTVIHYGGGHGVEFLEPTVLFEVKQGPYQGANKVKTFLKTMDI